VTRTAFLPCAVLGLVLFQSCGGSPTDPRIPAATGPPDRLAVTTWRFGAQTTSARVEATWGYLYSTQRDVTTEALWESSDRAVMRINRAGELVSVSPGEATLSITFRDVTVTHLMRVFSGESPLMVLTPQNSTYVSDTIHDARQPNARGIEGVTVEILTGHNAGRTATTDDGGRYYFYPPFICGPVTARASKVGYNVRVSSSVMCVNGMPDLALTPQ
jgi:hypothetical protein